MIDSKKWQNIDETKALTKAKSNWGFLKSSSITLLMFQVITNFQKKNKKRIQPVEDNFLKFS